ncbi:Sir2 family NAD-dependent protein deacetylase [Kocuria sp.]|uniref:Sir2 family NAD-dependent protein deacetylase n=1 Tax=Kocuria sp. TaxID=1871328 RepID=UPI0026DEB9DE|nr:Sir2 family NAD-dependent protein deacetylase [Kocuria sp.]MDO5619033.1 Sir2 family NAD-dependent protein deacetylase [Kocuria sp.]
MWARYSPQELATPEAWEDDPDVVFAWYVQRARMVRGVQPNPGHTALARWAQHATVSISTQNVDDLHERAGSTVEAHLHGSLFDFRCEACGRPADSWQIADLRLDSPVDSDPQPQTPPECLECDASIRPGVVWFGEALPMEAFQRAEEAMATADLVLVVGTSGIVQPAASLPLTALGLGVPVVEINPEPTEFSAYADFEVRLPSGEALPLLTASL